MVVGVVGVVASVVVADFAEQPGAPPGSPRVQACHPDSSTGLFSCDDGVPLSEHRLKQNSIYIFAVSIRNLDKVKLI